MKKCPQKKSQKATYGRGTAPRTAVRGAHGHPCVVARPCHQARGGGREVFSGRTAVRLNARSCVFCFARSALFLMSRASSNLYFSSQSSKNAIFACETRRFSLKAQKSHNISKNRINEANMPFSHLE